jgi:ubiquinone/menaquinone biosynthesis C-methylase UbiE
MSVPSPRDRRLRRYWDRQAGSYDRQMTAVERRFLRDTRPWLCGQATGDTLEVAIGTGLNIGCYPPQVRLTGVELSDSMLAIARRRAGILGRDVTLEQGDAQSLRFPDESFDTVACTFALCGIPDETQALTEMARVLRPGGLLLLADHIVSTNWPLRQLQRVVDLFSVPVHGEHYRRRPYLKVRDMGFHIEVHDRFAFGVIERFAARRPSR